MTVALSSTLSLTGFVVSSILMVPMMKRLCGSGNAAGTVVPVDPSSGTPLECSCSPFWVSIADSTSEK